MIFGDPGCHLGGPWRTVGTPWAELFVILGNPFANNFRSGLFETLLTEKVPKRVPLGGAGHAIRTRLRMFYEGRPVREKVTSEAASGGHFAASGSILHPFGST